ncbi:hypothetical protein Taro_026266, partial [Colocasia esculenta]|nr:hypothetical protein [Colocasia esculenta]
LIRTLYYYFHVGGHNEKIHERQDLDTVNWLLRYPDPCPQQGLGNDCAIFTCKNMECLARRDTQGFPFTQDDMPSMRARFTVHLIKAYFNAQERSEHI